MKILFAALAAAALLLAGAGTAAVQAQCCAAEAKAPCGSETKPGVYVWGVGSFEPASANVTRTVAKGKVVSPEEFAAEFAAGIDREREKRPAGGELDRLLRKGKGDTYPSTKKGIVLRPKEMLLAVTSQRFKVEFAGTQQDNTKGMFDPPGGLDTYGDKVFHTHKAAMDSLRQKVRFSGRLKADSTVVIDSIDASDAHQGEVRHMFLRIVGKTFLKETGDDEFQIFCDAGDQKVPLPTPKLPKERLEKLAGKKIVADGTLVHGRPGRSFGIQVIRDQGDKDEIPLPEDKDTEQLAPPRPLPDRKLDAHNRAEELIRKLRQKEPRPPRPKRDQGGIHDAVPDIRPVGPDGIRRPYVPSPSGLPR